MAEEATGTTEAPVATATGGTGEGTAKPADTSTTPNPAPAPNNSGWEAKEKAFIADLQKERRARQEFERQATTHKTELEIERRRVQALTGVNPKNPQDAEVDEIRNRFKQVIPREQLLEMLGIDEADLKSLKGSKTREEQVAALETQHWSRHGREMQAEFHKALAAEIGGDKLTDRQLRSVIIAFSQTCEENPEMLAKYQRGDTSIIKEFTQEWVEDWIKPAQRKVQATELGRNRPLPQGKDRSVTTAAGKKIDVTNDNEVADLLVAGFRERGGQFGRS